MIPSIRTRAARRSAVVLAVAAALGVPGCKKGGTTHRETTGEVRVVHAKVTVAGTEVRGVVRLSAGDEVTTGPDGRGRMLLDDGTAVVLDRATRATVSKEGISLAEGRLFVAGADGGHTAVTAGGVSTVAAGNALAFELHGDAASVYVANGEAVVRAAGKQEQVRSGETASLAGGGFKVAPEKAFNDWTSGMAAPGGVQHSAIGELSALSSEAEDPGVPLVIRSHDVAARLEGEVATTHVETTYFNGGSAAERGDFRIALPDGAVVSRFAVRRGESLEEGRLVEGREDSSGGAPATLAWAGSGWARGRILGIPSGETVTMILEYVEWLSPARGRLTYRYPMSGGDTATTPLIGEFHAKIDTGGASPRVVATGGGAVVSGSVVELRRADFRPLADLVVEALEPRELSAKDVRVSVAPALPGERSQDAYLIARADLPDSAGTPGIALSLVVDTSFSVSPSDLDAERAVVEALVEGLGPEDRVAVFAADQSVRPVGPDGMGPVDAGRRKAIVESLVALSPGGASDLGKALERAANALPQERTAAMVVYVGDGWPTVGDTDMQAIRRTLSRRAQGIPRIGAIAIGASANRFGLVQLAADSAPVLPVVDRAGAARAAVELLSTALEPAVEGVVLDLGAAVDRVYPRVPVARALGSTVTAVGRLRGALPKEATLSYFDGGRRVEQKRPVTVVPAASPDDVRRRWASARVREMSLEGIGLETAVEAAVKTSLLTPWTVWATGVSSGSGSVQVPPLRTRLLELESVDDVPFISRLAPSPPPPGAVLEPKAFRPREADIKEVVAASARRTIADAMVGVRKCRDLRAALRPEITGTLDVRVQIEGSGRATSVNVRSTEAAHDDGLLDRCIETLISNLVFFDSALPGTLLVMHQLVLPPARDPRKTQCSPASRLPLLVRRGIWRARLERSTELGPFLRARQSCELKTALEHRALVDLYLEFVRAGRSRLELARALEDAGEAEAAALFRRAAIRDATSPVELDQLRAMLVADEPAASVEFEKKYRAAGSDEERLAVVRRYLRLSPHDRRLRERLYVLLEVLGKKGELVNEVYALRQDPFADAAILADGAAALRRAGRPEEGLRAFGEIIERAPLDPYARALVGDRLRDEGLYDDATAAYDALAEIDPEDSAVALRMALAHAGAGRLDVATRILTRVAEGQGRDPSSDVAELASYVTSVLIAEAKKQPGPDGPRLDRRALEVPLPDVRGVVLVRSPALEEPVAVRIARGKSKGDPFALLDTELPFAAPTIGLSAARIERGDGTLRLRLSRPSDLAPARAARAHVALLFLDDDRRQERFVERDVDLLPDGKDTVLEWNGEVLQ